MYVRDEKLKDGNYHVFATAAKDLGILERVRFPLNEFSFSKEHRVWIKAEKGLVVRSIINPRGERAEKVNTFISEAYRLIREGPNASTFEEDAYAVAGLKRVEEKEARLKLIIDHYMRGPN